MTKHLHRDLDRVHRDILSLSAMVEDMIDKAALALRERRWDLAEEVAEDDDAVDQKEVAIEEECLKMLALHQPVAIDLRRIATMVKVNNDLERMADLAVNITERARCIGDYVTKPFSVKVLLERVKALCRRGEDHVSQQLVHSQGVTVDPTKHRVAINDQSLRLTRSEFRLLETLTREPGRVFSRSDLIAAALGDDTLVLERTIDVHIRAV